MGWRERCQVGKEETKFPGGLPALEAIGSGEDGWTAKGRAGL